jgi:hypothetical protein
MSPVERMYRDFCEHLAAACEAEAKVYEEHARLADRDFQFISSLRAKSNEWRQQLQRMETAHPAGVIVRPAAIDELTTDQSR